MANPTIADTLPDRLVQPAYRIELKGDSMRKHWRTRRIDPQKQSQIRLIPTKKWELYVKCRLKKHPSKVGKLNLIRWAKSSEYTNLLQKYFFGGKYRSGSTCGCIFTHGRDFCNSLCIFGLF